MFLCVRFKPAFSKIHRFEFKSWICCKAHSAPQLIEPVPGSRSIFAWHRQMIGLKDLYWSRVSVALVISVIRSLGECELRLVVRSFHSQYSELGVSSRVDARHGGIYHYRNV